MGSGGFRFEKEIEEKWLYCLRVSVFLSVLYKYKGLFVNYDNDT